MGGPSRAGSRAGSKLFAAQEGVPSPSDAEERKHHHPRNSQSLEEKVSPASQQQLAHDVNSFQVEIPEGTFIGDDGGVYDINTKELLGFLSFEEEQLADDKALPKPAAPQELPLARQLSVGKIGVDMEVDVDVPFDAEASAMGQQFQHVNESASDFKVSAILSSTCLWFATATIFCS